MKFTTSVRCDRGAMDKSYIIHELERAINSYISGYDYGSGIYEYFISFDIGNYPPGYEHLQNKFKPKYIEHKVFTSRFTGEKIEIIKQFDYGAVIDGDLYNKFINGTMHECKKIIATEIFKSLSNLDRLPKKVTDFNKDKFTADMKRFFENENLV